MKKNDYTIRLETPADYRETENTVREAFWNVYRPGCLEHYVLNCLRKHPDFVKELNFVMEKDGRIIGQACCVRAEIKADDGRCIPIMTLGPICILPQFQKLGYGLALLEYIMEKASGMGAGALCFEGDIGFYGRAGFEIASGRGIHYYAEPREAVVPYFLMKELTPGWLSDVTGVYRTPDVYFVDEQAAEVFDAGFPVKEKLKLPGQLA